MNNIENQYAIYVNQAGNSTRCGYTPPAMAAGVTSTLWSMDELLAAAEAA